MTDEERKAWSKDVAFAKAEAEGNALIIGMRITTVLAADVELKRLQYENEELKKMLSYMDNITSVIDGKEVDYPTFLKEIKRKALEKP